MAARLDGDAAAEWRKGWPVVLAGAMGMALATTHVYSTGLFMAPLEQEFGWSRTAISAGLTISAVVGVLTAPFVGLAIDRLGPRRIGLWCCTAFCIVFALLSTVGSSIWNWWALWLLLACTTTGIKPTVWTAAVSSLFARGRGLALSLMLCGTGLGSSLTPLICNLLIKDYGWRTAYLGLAGFWAVLVLPLLFFFFSSAKDRHRVSRAETVAVPAALTGMSAREGFRSPRFYKLAAGAFLIALVAVSFTVNMVPILSFTGLTRDNAAAIAGTIGISSIVGRITAGLLLDRLNGNIIAGVSVLLPIASCALLLMAPGSAPVSFVAAIILGLCLGSELDAVAYLATRHFGMRSFGVLFGTISGLLALATGVGPLLVSAVYDTTGSYMPVLWAYVPLCLIAAGLFFTLGAYPDAHGEPE
ncbi:MFS transporter [Sphingomonas solaris]|uniref:MFS transporter n=1 Tax=Alterirhizorhabdus solaris TaxID=2529389 RepID=UPI00139682AC|nr:MFS transporter [Sphingomonas solaris]